MWAFVSLSLGLEGNLTQGTCLLPQCEKSKHCNLGNTHGGGCNVVVGHDGTEHAETQAGARNTFTVPLVCASSCKNDIPPGATVKLCGCLEIFSIVSTGEHFVGVEALQDRLQRWRAAEVKRAKLAKIEAPRWLQSNDHTKGMWSTCGDEYDLEMGATGFRRSFVDDEFLESMEGLKVSGRALVSWLMADNKKNFARFKKSDLTFREWLETVKGELDESALDFAGAMQFQAHFALLDVNNDGFHGRPLSPIYNGGGTWASSDAFTVNPDTTFEKLGTHAQVLKRLSTEADHILHASPELYTHRTRGLSSVLGHRA